MTDKYGIVNRIPPVRVKSNWFEMIRVQALLFMAQKEADENGWEYLPLGASVFSEVRTETSEFFK